MARRVSTKFFYSIFFLSIIVFFNNYLKKKRIFE